MSAAARTANRTYNIYTRDANLSSESFFTQLDNFLAFGSSFKYKINTIN